MNYVNETFPTREDAEAFKERLYRSYHPLGYGTHVTIKEVTGQNSDKPIWLAQGSYSESCD